MDVSVEGGCPNWTAIELVHTTLTHLGLEPNFTNTDESGPLILNSRLQEFNQEGETGVYDFHCFQMEEREVSFLFSSGLGELPGDEFSCVLALCNYAHASLAPQGTLFLGQDDAGGHVFCFRSVIQLTDNPSEVCELVEKYFLDMCEFYSQVRWAVFDLITGGDFAEAAEMLSIGETRGQA